MICIVGSDASRMVGRATPRRPTGPAGACYSWQDSLRGAGLDQVLEGSSVAGATRVATGVAGVLVA